jgi:hypothetical protein
MKTLLSPQGYAQYYKLRIREVLRGFENMRFGFSSRVGIRSHEVDM